MPKVTFTQSVVLRGKHYVAGQQADVSDADMEHLTKNSLIQQDAPKAKANTKKADDGAAE